MKTKGFLCAVMLVALAATMGFAQTWDLYTGVSHGPSAVNPSGPWSFGSMSSATANDFALSPVTFSYAGLFCWTRTEQQFIGKNTIVGWADDGTFSVPQGWLVMVSNSSVVPGEQTLRWTSPMDGSVYVSAMFAGGNYQDGIGVTSNGSIVKNGVVFYTAHIVGFDGDYARAAWGSNPRQTISGVIPVAIGDNIDFVVDTDFDGSGYDHTRLYGSIINLLDIPGTLEGEITLEDYDGPLPLSPVEIVFTPVVGGRAQTSLVTLEGNPGTYSVGVSPGTYSVAFSACKFLRKVVPGVVITMNNATMRNVPLVNGDLDGDNEVAGSDLNMVLTILDQTGN